MTLQNVLVVVAVSLSNAAIWLWWIGWPRPFGTTKRWVTGSPARTAGLIGLMCAALWIGILVVCGFPITGEVKLAFQAPGRAVRSGAIPNVDFRTSYMPLFSYWMSLVEFLWADDRAMPLFFVASFVAANLLLRHLLVADCDSPGTASALTVVGTLNGASWFLAIGYQQDESLMFLFMVAAILLLLRGRELAAGTLLGVGLVSTKVFFGMCALGLIFQARNARRVLTGMIAAGPFVVLFAYLGSSIPRILGGESLSITPASITTLLTVFPPIERLITAHTRLIHVIVGLWCLTMAILLRNPGERPSLNRSLFSLLVIWLGFLLLSPKSLTS